MDEARRILGGKCMVCGTTDRLEFDHIDPKTKLHRVSDCWDFPAEFFWLEVAKCQLLCRRHHHEKSKKEGSMASIGESNPNSKLRDLDVKYIRGLSALGHSQRAIAREFGVSHTVVGDILRGKIWTHVV